MDHRDPRTPAAVQAAWRRELPDVPTRSIPVVTALKQVAGALARARAETLRALGVEAATLDLLATLRRAGPPYVLTTHELSRRCFVTAGAMSQRVARAETAGLVARAPAAGGRVEVQLTPAGHRVVETTARAVLEADEAVTAALADDDLVQLEALLGGWAGRLAEATRAGADDGTELRPG